MPRLIDLHCDWLLQYAPETTVFDPALYPGVAGRFGQAEGYLQATSASVLACVRSRDDWARQADPWRALGALLTRIEAEFPGRLLIGPDDHARWRDDPDGPCWGVIGVEGFDTLVRGPDDLDRLPGLFTRGVRVFQPIASASTVLGGSATPGDDRGLTDLGRAMLGALLDLGPTAGGPRPILDLAQMNPGTASDVLDWLETEPGRADRLIPVYSHGAIRHAGSDGPRAITPENLARLRTLGGVIGLSVGPPFYPSTGSLKAGIESAAALPFLGRSGCQGIAIGTDFLGIDQTVPGLGNAEEVVAWVVSSFDPATADAIVAGNARDLFRRATGAPADPGSLASKPGSLP